MTVLKVLSIIFGIIIVLVGIGLLFSGGALLWLEKTHTDSEGFITSDPIRIERDSRAVVTGPIELDEVAMDVLNWMGLATSFAVDGSNENPSKDIFMGVAKVSDMEAYLNDVNYDEMSFTDTRWLSLLRVEYENHAGSSEPPPPASQTFWAVSQYGSGMQELEWETEAGSHSIVLMNSDGSAGIDLNAVLKVKVPGSLFAISVGLMVGGIVVLAIGLLMIILPARRL